MRHFIVISKKSKIYWYSSQWTTVLFGFFFQYHKKQMTQKLQCKYLVLHFANFCKEKRNADYKVYTFSLFFTKIATQETHLHP